MSVELRQVSITVPADTPEDAPAYTDIDFPPRTVTAIQWRVPPGPRGSMGWRIEMSGYPLIPYEGQQWIVADDEGDTWALESIPDSGSFTVVAYNTGTYDHALYLRFMLGLIGVSTPAPIPLIASGFIE